MTEPKDKDEAPETIKPAGSWVPTIDPAVLLPSGLHEQLPDENEEGGAPPSTTP